MLCAFARQFASWIKEIAAPLAIAGTQHRLTEIVTGPGLVCRTRYGRPGEKISEHARGNAIDIAAFRLDGGTSLPVKDGGEAGRQELLRALRTAACGYFTTVLGPGSNEAHKEHLHFDLGMHGRSMNYRICE
jgi:hypothetical protein